MSLRGIFAATVALFLLFPPSPSSGSYDVFDNASGWTTVLGDKEMVAVSREAAIFSRPANVYFIDGPSCTDYRLEAEVAFRGLADKYSGFSIYLRYQGNGAWGSGNGYWLYWRPLKKTVFIQKVVKGKIDASFAENVKRKSLPPEWIANEKYKVACAIRGNQITVWIDDRLILVADDALNPHVKGRTVFGMTHADGCLSSLKLTSLEQTEKIQPMTYRYLSQPEKGDETSSILTDGIADQPLKQAHWALDTRGQIGMIFDLQREYLLREVIIKSRSIPALNFSSAELTGSPDGRTWFPLGSLLNGNSDRVISDHVVKGPLEGIARYVKIVFYRAAADNVVDLSEIELWGTKDLAVTKARKVEYFSGPALPKPAFASIDEDENYWYLHSAAMVVAIHKKTGVIAGIADRRTRGTPITRVWDEYFYEDRRTSFIAGEHDDRVVGKDAAFPGSLQVVAENPKCSALRIRKTYQLSKDGTSLRKEIELVNSTGQPEVFVTVKTNLVLDPKYRQEGYYLGADRGLGGRKKASGVLADTYSDAHAPLNTKFGLFVNYTRADNVAQFLYKVNGYYVNPVANRWTERENVPITYTRNGWKMGLTTLHLRPRSPQSTEYRILLFEGTEYDCYRAYRNLPDVAEKFRRNAQRPAWLKDLKTGSAGFAEPLTPESGPASLETVARSLDLYDEGYILCEREGDIFWGDWRGKGWGCNYFGGKVDLGLVRAQVKKIKAMSGRVKVGIYGCWAWSGAPFSQAYQRHPEWFIRKDKAGNFITAYTVKSCPNYVRLLNNKESAQALLSGAEEILREINPDYFYLDGGEGGVNLIDWERGSLDQIDDWDRFHEELKAVTQRYGREKVVFFNCRQGSVFDIGFFEGVGTQMNSAGWRESADSLTAIKIRQKFDPGQRVIPIQWRQETLPFYANYCIGLGLTPYNNYSASELVKTAYVTAAYDHRDLEILDGRYVPDWRRDPEANLEVHTLRNGQGRLLSVIDHSEVPRAATVAVDKASIGFKADDPLYGWRFRIKDIRTRLARGDGLPERTSRQMYRERDWGGNLIFSQEYLGLDDHPGTYRVTRTFDYDLLNLVVLSRGPALLYGVEGRRLNVWQPSLPGVSLISLYDKDRNQIVIDRQGDTNIDAIVCVPNSWKEIGVEGGRLRHVLFLDRQQFAVVAMPKATTKAVLHPKQTWAPRFVDEGKVRLAYGGTETSPSEITRAAASLTIEFNLDKPVDRYFGNIYEDSDVLVHTFESSNNKIMLSLPDELMGGTLACRVWARGRDGTVYEGKERITVPNRYRHTPSINLVPKRSKPAVVFQDVGTTINGVNITRTARLSFDGYYGGLTATIDCDALAMTVGNIDSPPTRYGYAFAGFESDNLHILTIEASSNVKRVESVYPYMFWSTTPENMVGLILDYHTPKGYSRRVALGLGCVNSRRSSSLPHFGASRKADAVINLTDFINTKERDTFTIDVRKWAPHDWDGRMWFIASSFGLAPRRTLSLKIRENCAKPDGKVILEGTDPALMLKPVYRVKKIGNGQIKVDGKLDEPVWGTLTPMTTFYVLGGLTHSPQRTEAYLCRDDKYVYVGVRCFENVKPAFSNRQPERIWENDGIDISVDPTLNAENMHKIVVDCMGRIFQADYPSDSKKIRWKVMAGAGLGKASYEVEVAIPRADLVTKGSRDDQWLFNIARNRPDEMGINMYTWSPILEMSLLDPKTYGKVVVE